MTNATLVDRAAVDVMLVPVAEAPNLH